MWQVVHIMFITNNNASFHLCWKENWVIKSIQKSQNMSMIVVHIFSYSYWIRIFIYSVNNSSFYPNIGESRPKTLRVPTYFTQWLEIEKGTHPKIAKISHIGKSNIMTPLVYVFNSKLENIITSFFVCFVIFLGILF